MKNNGISYAERKRISLKIERNNSMYSQNTKLKKESLNSNKKNQKSKIKRLSSYKEPPNSSCHFQKEVNFEKSIIDKEKEKEKENSKIKENSKLFKKINLNNDTIRNKTIKPIKNVHSIPTLKYIDINNNNYNNNKKLLNNKSSIDCDDYYFKKDKLLKKKSNNDTQICDKHSFIKKKKKMNNSYCSSNKDITKIINNSNNNFISITSKSSRKCDDILLVQDEILELKLINSRYNNEVIILKEKNNSLKEIIDMKDKEMKMIKNKYMQMIEETNNEQIKIKQKLENDYKSLQKKYDISIKSIKSLIETVIELTETLIYTEKNNNYPIFSNGYKNLNFNQISFSAAAECSLDMYESNPNTDNNKDDDKDSKRNLILEQIKEIIIEKINNIIYKLNLVLDSSILDKIERLNSWNFHNFNMKYSPNYSFNLNNYPKRTNTYVNNTNNLNDELFSGSLSKCNMSLNNEVSNDFDFSVSKSFYNPSSNISASPKFNRSIKVEKNSINDNGKAKSLLFSFDEASKMNIVKNNNKLNNTGNNNLNGNNNNIFNILEYSMVDLINSGEYASSNIHNIININNTINNNNFTESKENNFKGFYESFSNSNSKNIMISSKEKIKNEKNNVNNLLSELPVDEKKKNDNNEEEKINKNENSDIGNITLKDIEQ